MRTLGSPAELRADGTLCEFTNGKHLALLAYLLMEPGEHGRDQLTRFIWSSGAAGSMDTALSELRSVFGPGLLPPRARSIALAPDLVEVDALWVLTATDPTARARAIDSYRGAFFEKLNTRGGSDRFVRWIERTRSRIEEAFLNLCELECEAAVRRGDWQRVLDVARRGLHQSPEWSVGERWREVGERGLRDGVTAESIREIAAPPDADGFPRAPITGPTPAAPPSVRQSWRLAVAVVATILLLAFGWFLMPDRGEQEELVRMPPIRAEDLPAPGEPVRARSDWIRADGQWIYYRYEDYLPAACRHRTRAVGNFGRTGWTEGVPVSCLNSAWLAVDGQRLIERYALSPETTYCLQFLYVEGATSVWGLHGLDNAPGLDSFRVVAPSGAYNIGFALVPAGLRQRHIELTNRFLPASRC